MIHDRFGLCVASYLYQMRCVDLFKSGNGTVTSTNALMMWRTENVILSYRNEKSIRMGYLLLTYDIIQFIKCLISVTVLWDGECRPRSTEFLYNPLVGRKNWGERWLLTISALNIADVNTDTATVTLTFHTVRLQACYPVELNEYKNTAFTHIFLADS